MNAFPQIGSDVRRTSRALSTLALAAALASLAGCGSRPNKVESSLADTLLREDSPRTSVLDFFDALEDRPRVCLDDVITGVLFARKGTAPSGSDGYAARVKAAIAEGLVPSTFDLPGDQIATTGDVARIVVAAARRADVTAQPTTAAALKILSAGGWMPKGLTGDEPATGMHLLTALTGLSELVLAGGVELNNEIAEEPGDEAMHTPGDSHTPLNKAFPELGLAPDESQREVLFVAGPVPIAPTMPIEPAAPSAPSSPVAPIAPPVVDAPAPVPVMMPIAPAAPVAPAAPIAAVPAPIAAPVIAPPTPVEPATAQPPAPRPRGVRAKPVPANPKNS